jgi:hypothetical protein
MIDRPKRTVTPERLEQLRLMREKALANKAARRAAAASEEPPPPAEEPQSLADLGIVPPEDDLRLDDILSDAEIAEIRAAARAKVASEQKKKRRKVFEDMALEEARRDAKDIPPDEENSKWLMEMVQITIRMPRLRLAAPGKEAPPEPIIIDQKIFTHGRTYTVPRHQAHFLDSIMCGAAQHVSLVDGRSRTYYSDQMGTTIYQGGTAQGGTLATPGFDSIHRRAA